MKLNKEENRRRTFRYPEGVPENFVPTIEDLPPTTDRKAWTKLGNPIYLIKTLSDKEVTHNITNEYVDLLKQPVILLTTIREAKKLCKITPRHELVLFGMKQNNKLLELNVNGQLFAFHKIWYLFCRDLWASNYQIINENDDDLVLVGLGFREPEPQNEPYLFCWGDVCQRSHLESRSQNVYLVSGGMAVPRYTINW